MAIDPNNLANTATLTFSEDFNNLSLWNGSTGTWSTTYNFNGYSASTLANEQEWYINANDPNQASVKPWSTSNGILTITAKPSTGAIKPYIDNYDYTSGLLTTQNSFSQTYGYFEIDAKLPAGQGLWPAFWLMPTDGDYRPEIDVFEVLGANTQSLWQFSHPADQTYDRYFNTTVPDMSAGFHRYGVDWEPDQITFYFDGKVMGTAPTAPDMNSPMYMLLNLAVGGTWGGPPNSTTTWPAGMQVDYIHVYQSNTTGGSGSDTTTGGAGSDVFTIAPGAAQTINGFSSASHDMLAIAAGSTGFQLAGYTGQASPTIVDVSNSWTNISNAQIIRWLGSAANADSASEVDGILQSLPGNQTGGAIVVAYAPNDQVGLYYDSDPAHPGGVSLVATLSGVTNVTNVTAASFEFASGSSGGSGGTGGTTGGGGETTTGGSGADVFTIAPGAPQTINGFSASTHDMLAITAGSGGFQLAGYTGQSTPTIVDASSSWANISNAQIIRWLGAAANVNSASEVDGLLQAMPGNQTGGALVVAYTPDNQVGLYYDSDPAHPGGASLVATLAGVTDVASVTDASFEFATGSSSGGTTGGGTGGTTGGGGTGGTTGGGSGSDTLSGSTTLVGTSNDDTFMLSTSTAETFTQYDQAGHDQVGIPVGSGGFILTGASGQSVPTVVDASAWWNNISGAQVIRWTGDHTALQNASQVDGLLQSMPGNQAAGVFVVAYDSTGEVAIYYDSSSSAPGGDRLVATIANLTDTHLLSASDFHLFS